VRRIIDSHLDLAWNALGWNRDLTRPIEEINRLEAGMADHVARGHAVNSLPEMRRGQVAVCMATVLAGSDPDVSHTGRQSRMNLEYRTQELACAVGRGQLAYYRLLEERGQMRMLRTRADLDAHWASWLDGGGEASSVGFVLAMEGADPIARPEQAQQWWDDGLRCASLVHFGRSRYAVGTGKIGPISDDGRKLLREFERLGIILDTTHLCDRGFEEALDLFDGAVAATHSNCRALVPGDRQMTDDQIRRLVGRGGVIGVCLDAWMLWPGWEIGKTSREVVGLGALADHIDHICQLAGNCKHVGFGTDADGGYGTEQAPREVRTIADLQRMGDILAGRGYDDPEIDAVFHANWLEFFRRHLPA
jgi:membrane dipeptidase